MAAAQITAKYPPNIDVTKAPLAYGKRALPRLYHELTGTDLLTKQRAARSLCDYLHDPENIAAALRVELARTLKRLLTDKDPTVRTKVTECLYVIAQHNIGRDAILKEGLIVPLSGRFIDKVAIVRQNAHHAMAMVSEIPWGAEAIVEAKLVPRLVARLDADFDPIKEYVFDTLHFCMKIDTKDALESFGMEIFTKYLKSPIVSLRAKAARNIMGLSRSLPGKNKAVEVKCMPLLVELLSDEDTDVRAFSAAAIMSIAITTRGKYTALAYDCIEPLIERIDDESSEVRVNSLKALTCVSEAPEGRAALQQYLRRFKLRTKDPVPNVIKAAKRAVEVVSWKP